MYSKLELKTKFMKRLLICIYFVCLIHNDIYAQCYRIELNDVVWERQLSDLARYEIKGPVSKVTKYSYKALDSFGSITKGERVCHNEILFNENGVIQKIISFNENDKIDGLTSYEYEDGRKKFETNYNEKGELLSKTVYSKEGRTLSEQRYFKDGSLNDRYLIYNLDEKGNIIKKEYKNHNAKSSRYSEAIYFSYDNYNRIIKVNEGGGPIHFSYSNIYSKKPIKFSEFDAVKQKVTSEGYIEYNNKGDIIKIIKNGKLQECYEYTYDERDNWITRIEFETEAKIPESIVNRKIEYLK